MKTFSIAIALLAVILSACSQQYDNRRKIQVTGSAETEVTPDIIYFGISLREYVKSPGNKVAIETLEKQLYDAVIKAGIPKENFTINNLSSYNYIWEKRKNPDFLARKQYRIKVNNLSKLTGIINAVDPKSIEYTNIEGYDYSKMEQIQRDVKVKALHDARKKATYLAKASDDELGETIEVHEVNNEANRRANYDMMNAEAASQSLQSAPNIDFKKIKLTYLINAVFEVK